MKIVKWLAIILIGIPLLITGCFGQVETATAPEPTMPPSSESEPTPPPQVRLTAKEAYDIALNHATAEFGEVYLSQIRAGYATIVHGWPRDIADGCSDEWSVSFRKQYGEDQWAGILLTVENGEVTYSAEGEPYPLRGSTWADYVLNFTVDVSKWNITSPEAVKIAEAAGGAEFRLLMLCLTAHWQDPKWYIVFGPVSTEKGEHPGFAVEVNAANGEVISTKPKTFQIY